MVQEIMEMTKKNTTLYQQMYDSKYNPFSSRIKEKMIPAIQAVKGIHFIIFLSDVY